MNISRNRPRANVLGTPIDAVNMQQALARVEEDLRLRRKGYVCLTGVHGVMESKRDPILANILANASLNVPDGMPTVWVGRHQGHAHMERVTGSDLMLEIIRRPEFLGYTHFLCGGKPGVAEELRDSLLATYPEVQIVGTYTPPFGPMSRAQEEDFLSTVNRAQPDIVWIGISTPKQEKFMDRYLPLLDTTLMFSVGAAFDFHTGRIADCSEWIKRSGLQWLNRLLQDPRHLWKRYLRIIPAFLFHISLQLTGLQAYPLQRSVEVREKRPERSRAEPESAA
jgi:N-acetylglucosaminyldiphosphoundecaprenol N-acetyl-beta-D-mannosaminyltransferase